MKSFIKNFFSIYFLIYFFYSAHTIAKETWILDKELSTINFELPVLLANNVKGSFQLLQGLVEIDLDNKINNKAIFSIDIHSVEMNYNKYKTLLLSDIFFDSNKFPIALVDTKKFSYQDEKEINLNVELSIKGISNSVPLTLEIIQFTKELVQIKGRVEFSRTAFQIGINQWKNTSVLKDMANIDLNLFLFKK